MRIGRSGEIPVKVPVAPSQEMPGVAWAHRGGAPHLS
ncbi:hypothetical protein PLANTIT3_20294 [Plantibacter sp. T3]|nr:hypothetical protein PLANTIT3_20294 [Plantibacter sp. T3]